MKFPYLRWLVLTFPLLLAAEPVVKLPKEVHAKPGRLVRLHAETDGKHVRWVNADPDNADLIPLDERSMIFSAPAAGTYRVWAYTAAGDVPSEPAVCLIVVGDGPAPPPPPNPPAPSDPLTKAVRDAYATDPDPQKAVRVKALSDFYRTTATNRAKDQSVFSVGDLFAALTKDRRAVLPDDAVKAVRGAVGDFLNAELGTKPADPLDRDKAAKAFVRVADALGAVK